MKLTKYISLLLLFVVCLKVQAQTQQTQTQQTQTQTQTQSTPVKYNSLLDPKKIFSYKYTLGVGFSTIKILNPNPNSHTMNYRIYGDSYLGGSFKGAQPGIDLKANIQIDDEGKFRIPIGFDFSSYSAKERIPINANIEDKLENTAFIYAPYIGLNYHFVQIPKARASFYFGVEARGSFLSGPNFRFIRTYNLIPEESFDITEHNKANTFRLGGIVKLGLEGDLMDNYMINSSLGYGVLNAFMRDNSRGELLTPRKQSELKETFLQGIFISIMIQYRFN